MVAGTWYNQDGLYLQYGTQKQVPEIGGEYLVYGETREVEQYIPLVPTQFGSPATAGSSPFVVPGAPTSFSGTTTAIAAGIQSLTTLFPLQSTPLPTGLTSGTIILDRTQLFIETVEVETIVGATGGTSLAVGLATTSQLPGSPNATFVQVTPNAGVQLLNGLLIANMANPGMRATFWTPTASSGIIFGGTGFATAIAGNGAWLSNVPLVTNVITPLPQSAWISSIASGTFTSGLVKIRVRYTIYGNITF